MQQYLKFQAPKESQEFKLLSVQASLHVTARQKNIELLKVVASKGVIFKDIRSHLMNEAKRCGLWEKGKSEDYYKLRAWYVAVVNFVIWVKKHYSDYNVVKVKAVEVPVEKKVAPREIIVRSELKKDTDTKPNIVINTPDPKEVKGKTPEEHKALGKASDKALATGAVTEEQGEIARLKALLAEKEKIEVPDNMKAPEALPVGSAVKVAELPQGTAAKKGAGEVINRPIEECLTTVQIQMIIFKNLEILANKAVELGAGQEWNDLMNKMGLCDECVEFDEPVRIQLEGIPTNPVPAN